MLRRRSRPSADLTRCSGLRSMGVTGWWGCHRGAVCTPRLKGFDGRPQTPWPTRPPICEGLVCATCASLKTLMTQPACSDCPLARRGAARCRSITGRRHEKGEPRGRMRRGRPRAERPRRTPGRRRVAVDLTAPERSQTTTRPRAPKVVVGLAGCADKGCRFLAVVDRRRQFVRWRRREHGQLQQPLRAHGFALRRCNSDDQGFAATRPIGSGARSATVAAIMCRKGWGSIPT